MKDKDIIEEPKAVVVDENNEIFVEYSYYQFLELRLRIVEGKIPINLYLRNEYGGVDKIDNLACCYHYEPFPQVTRMYRDIIKAQCEIRRKQDNEKTT